MATRHQTYQMSYGWITIDTKTENPPENFISGPFDVTMAETGLIENAAKIELSEDETEVIVTSDGEV